MNSMRDLVIEKLKEAGYEVRPADVSKNGIKRTGIVIMFPSLTFGVTVYLDYYETVYKDEYTEEDIVKITDDIISIYESSDHLKGQDIENIKESLTSKEFVLENSYVVIQRVTDEDIIKIPVLDLEAYIRIDCSKILSTATGLPTIKVNEALLKSLGLDANELFMRAVENTKNRISIYSMLDVLKELGITDEEIPDTDIGMTIVSNEERLYGAAALLYPEIFREFCIKNNLDGVYILPSSIHECIIQPMIEGAFNEDELKETIRMVNETEVSEEDFLSNSLYAYSVKRDGIYIV